MTVNIYAHSIMLLNDDAIFIQKKPYLLFVNEHELSAANEVKDLTQP